MTTPHAPHTAPEKREVNLVEYWRIVWAGKWTILSVFAVVTAVVAVATFMMTPVYRATARIEVSGRSKSMAPSSDFAQIGAGWGWMAEERYLNTQMEIIRSRDIAEKVVRDLGLDQDPAFAGSQDRAGALSHRIVVEAIPETNILEISMEGPDPAAVRRLVNGVARTYVARNVEIAAENTAKTLDELLKQVQPIRDKITGSERQLLALAREKQLYIPESQTATMTERISQFQKQLTDVQIERADLEAEFQEISRLERTGGSFLSLPRVAQDKGVQELLSQANGLEKDLERLSVTYLDKHPRVVEVRTQRDDVRRKIDTEVDRIISNVKVEYSLAMQNERSLQDQTRRAQEESLDLSVASTDYKILKSEIEEDRRIYDLILARIKEIDLNQETLSNNLRVLDDAILPVSPVRPRRAVNLLAGAMLGLILGIGTVVVIDYLDNTVKTSEDVEHYLNLHILSVVPKHRKEASSSVNEAYQTLRTSILFSSKARTLNTMLVTSAGPGEGKTSTAVNLARTLAAAGDRVAIVDADLRRPTVHNQLGVERAGGLTNYLLSAERGEAWLRFVKDVPGSPNLKVLTCGPIPPNPPELFGTEKFLDLVSQLRRSFDWLIIDSPPLASLSDSLVLGSLVEMVVLVIKHNENDRDLIRRSVASLRKVNANVIGAVLNNVDLSRTAYKDYYYSGYEYYSRHKDAEVETVEGDTTASEANRRA